MNSRAHILLNFFILLLLLALNAFIFLNRNNNYAYTESLSYEQLYELKGSARILEMHWKQGDSLLLKIDGVPENSPWNIKTDGLNYVSSLPCLKLKEGRHAYVLQNQLRHISQNIEIGLNYTPSSEYKKNKRQRNSVAELYYASIPAGDYKTYSLQDWQQSSAYITNEEKEIVHKLILNNTGLKKEDPTIIKLQKISAFILSKLDKKRGIPGDTMESLSPYQRYKAALEGRSKVWCGDLSSILAFFLAAESISCREVCLEGKINDVHLAGHSFNEVYLPEQAQWILTDLTSPALALSHEGQYLNCLQLYYLHKNNVQGIQAISYRNDSLVSTAYENLRPFYHYYFANNTQFVYYLNKQYKDNLYSFTSKLRRYFSKDNTFVKYAGTSKSDNLRFYVKQGAAFLLLAFVIYLLLHLCISLLFKSRKEK